MVVVKDMLAEISMYDWPEVWGENDAFWTSVRDGLRHEGIEAPDKLDRSVAYKESWDRSDLVLGQACGLPFIQDLIGKVSYIGALDLRLEGCPAGYYRSMIVVRASCALGLDDLEGRSYAFNSHCSQSGFASMSKMGLTKGRGVETGGHRASVEAVAQGRADFAAIDAYSWSLAQAHVSEAQDLKVIGSTPPTPAPVYIASLGADVEAYRRVLPDVVPLDPRLYESLL